MDVLALRSGSGVKLSPPSLASRVVVAVVCLSSSIASPRRSIAEESPGPTQLVPTSSAPTASEKLQSILTALTAGDQEDKATQSQATKQYHKILSEWESSGQNDFHQFAPRMMSIAESSIDDPGARDALFWIISSVANGDNQDIKKRAAMLLIDHHADDVELTRATLMLRIPSADREFLLDGLVEESKSHEVQGLVRMALAQYLKIKAIVCRRLQTETMEPMGISLYGETYISQLRSCDLALLEKKTLHLLEEIIAEYGDVSYVRSGRLGALDRLSKKTLADKANSLMDEIRNLAIGKPAPSIDGVDFHGKPLSLSAYRGRVVVLVFWASWCGPCMAEIPRERELVKSLSDKPFTLLGVNCDVDQESARKTAELAEITWANWYDGFPTPVSGPIVERFHIDSLPAVFVIDADGMIRAKGQRDDRLEKTVRELLRELDATNENVPSKEPQPTE